MDNNNDQNNQNTQPIEIPVVEETPITVVEAPLAPESEAVNEAPQAPDVEKKIELEGNPAETPQLDGQIEQVVEQPVGPDPSFNCPSCKGSGLIVNEATPNGVICSSCNGTGKVA